MTCLFNKFFQKLIWISNFSIAVVRQNRSAVTGIPAVMLLNSSSPNYQTIRFHIVVDQTQIGSRILVSSQLRSHYNEPGRQDRCRDG